MIRAQPMDAVVLIGGCDKTLPAQIMAAAQRDLPAIVIPVGPDAGGHHKGEGLGACTDCRRLWGAHRAGEIDEQEIEVVNGRLAPSVGTCMVMGTASTMACITEAMGLSLPDVGDDPGRRMPSASGSPRRPASARSRWPRRRTAPERDPDAGGVPQRAWSCCRRSAARPTAGPPRRDRRPPRRRDRPRGASTSSAARCPCSSTSSRPASTTWSNSTSGRRAAAAARARRPPRLDVPTVAGGNIARSSMQAAEDVAGADRHPHARQSDQGDRGAWRCCAATSRRVARSSSTPPRRRACCSIPDAPSCSTRSRTWRRGSTIPSSTSRADDVLVLRNAGPNGAPGMPEAGYLPIPRKLAAAGREGHGADLGRAHERHGFRHHRAAHHAGSARSAARWRWCGPAT